MALTLAASLPGPWEFQSATPYPVGQAEAREEAQLPGTLVSHFSVTEYTGGSGISLFHW